MQLPASLQPIRRRLPLLISALLLAVVAAFSTLAYRRLEHALDLAGSERVKSASQRLALAFEESARRLRSDTRRLATDSALVAYMRGPQASTRALARATLERQTTTNTQLMASELVSASGESLLLVGTPPANRPAAPDFHVIASDTAWRGVWIGPMAASSDTVYYEIATPVVGQRDDTLGLLRQYRRVSSAQGAQLIGGLIGSDASVLIGDAQGGIWTDFSGPVTTPPGHLLPGKALTITAPGEGARLGVATRVSRTPWLVLVSMPRRAVLAPARSMLGGLMGLAVLVVAIGTLGAWLVSRQVSQPLAEITHAAEGIAAGDYSRRVDTSRRDELGRLGKSFNGMAQQIADSTHALEVRVADRTRELALAMRELREAQETLVRRERLAILGQLAGGVGHELRNPLGVMTNALYFLTAVLKDAPAQVQEYLGILRTQVGLSEKIVGDLLDYARVKPPRAEPTSLERLAADQLERAGPLNGTTVTHDFDANLPPAYIDRVQMGQVVLNLITNALQAVPDHGGSLTLRGRLDRPGRIRLDVTDNGSGIAEEHLEKIFEPLFTTKARGIGLGLSVSRSLVQANRGEISVVSRVGEGTTFSVLLPTAADEAA